MKIQRKNNAFTLVEILIVVIILGILAAIVIPQFTEASDDARESTLTSNLQVLRSTVGLYRMQHLDTYPATTDSATFVTALTSQSDENGTVPPAAGFRAFGPYMQNVPNNPFENDSAIPLFTFGTLVADTPTAAASHWWFNSATGELIANDGGTSPDDVTLHADL